MFERAVRGEYLQVLVYKAASVLQMVEQPPRGSHQDRHAFDQFLRLGLRTQFSLAVPCRAVRSSARRDLTMQGYSGYSIDSNTILQKGSTSAIALASKQLCIAAFASNRCCAEPKEVVRHGSVARQQPAIGRHCREMANGKPSQALHTQTRTSRRELVSVTPSGGSVLSVTFDETIPTRPTALALLC